MRIAIIEDDEKMRHELSVFLQKYGYEVCTLENFEIVIEEALNKNPDLILLDINLPLFDGYYVCREIRKHSSVPIIILTSRNTEMDELMGMNLGADDFVSKPYNMQILLARIESVLKRTYKADFAQKLSHNGVSFDLSKGIVEFSGKYIELTKNEMKILHLLMKNSGKIISRDEIMNALWQSDEFIDDNTLTVNINRLRKKLEGIGVYDFFDYQKRTGVYGMSFVEYLKEKALYFFIGILCAVFVVILLIFTGSNLYAVAYSFILIFIGIAVCVSVDYLKRKDFYKNLLFCMRAMDKLYLLSEMVSPPGFYEGNVLCEALKLSNKAMNDQIAFYKNSMEEYREYIESWVHEIKTPIASGMLIVENNQGNAIKSIGEELEKIDAFVEQALFYSRSSSVEKDYIIKEQSLRGLVLSAVRRNSKALIQNKVFVEVEDFDFTVHTDSKWIDFILNQIISNSIKYKSENSKIKFSAQKSGTNISLFIEDNGIGISQKDVGRVFEKGFTGENGRKFKKSTGIGLYLCKKLCDKLGLSISISSEENKWTQVEIVFPKGGTHLLS